MLKKSLLGLVVAFSLYQTCSYAQDTNVTAYDDGHWALQGMLTKMSSDGAAAGLGGIRYEKNYEVGLDFNANINNAGDVTRQVSVGLLGGLRYWLTPQTVFAYGLSLGTQFGKDEGKTISFAGIVGPYVGIEYYLSKQVLLSAWINPYLFEYDKYKGDDSSISTHHIFNTGGIGISYLF